MAQHFFYLARCSDGSLYAGTCIDLRAREQLHNSGKGSKYARGRLPLKMIYHEVYATLPEARAREMEIKQWPKVTKERLVKSAGIHHRTQRQHWEMEHRVPRMLAPMSAATPSRGVQEFVRWLQRQKKNLKKLSGIEMGCGKGRNALWLAQQGVAMTGFDFSRTAIAEAKKRAQQTKIATRFVVADATKRWPFANASFHVGVDCFASSDIESSAGREFARREFRRVIKPGGYLLVYAISTGSQFHRAMIQRSPANQLGSFTHPSGKFEKACTWPELKRLYAGWSIVLCRTLCGKGEFYGRKYRTENLWMVLKRK